MVRRARWAGQFYPAGRNALAASIDALLAAASPPAPAARSAWGLLVPHAGHVYSGASAAAAYAGLAANPPARILLVGPAHHVPVAGFGLSRDDGWRSPLGECPIDTASVEALLETGHPFGEADAAIELEHSLEVQLPFLRRVAPDALLLPMLMGDVTPGERRAAGAILAERCGDDDWLWLFTTDLSHFHDRATATRLDDAAAALIAAGDPEAFAEGVGEGKVEACGAGPIALLLEETRRRGARVELLHRSDSSEASGDEGTVVGYLAAACTGGRADA